MGGNRVRNSLTGFAAAVTVTGLLAGLGTAAGTRPAAAATRTAGTVAVGGVPEGGASPVISATTKLSLRRYVAAGTGAYVVGAEDGTFPPIGWHTTGQMGGVWAPPTKLLDGLWFSVGSHWLADAAKYTTGPGFVRLSFPVTGGLRPTLTEFAPDGQPTVQALGVLHEMALAMGDHSTAAWAAQHQQAMLKAFHQWWIASQNLYADSMCEGTEGDCTHAGQQLQQRWWTTVAPMEQGIAPAANAGAALTAMEGPTFTGTCGLFVDGVGGPSGTGGQTCYLVNTGAMARAEANYGRTTQAVSYMDKVASQLTVEMPGSLPELAASAQYNPFEPFTSRANVMQAWSSYGVMWTVVNDLLGVTPDVPQRTVAVVPEVPASWPSLSVSKLQAGSQSLAVNASHQAGTYRTQVSGATGLTLTIGAVLPAGAKPSSVTLDGQKAHYTLVTTTRGTAVEVSVKAPAAQETLTVQTAG